MRRARVVAGVAGAVAAAAAAGAIGVQVARRARRAVLPEEHLDGREFEITTSDGAVLAATDAGEGPLVVLAHCYTGSRVVWAPVARRLVATGHRVVLWDHRGHGKSTVGSAGLTIERLGDDVREVLEAVDAGAAVLVGHSLGGMAVMALAARHPAVLRHRARSVVLVSTAAWGLDPVVPLGTVAAVASSPLATMVTASAIGPFVVRALHGPRPSYAQAATSARLYAKTPPATRAALLRSMTGMDLRAGLAACTMPSVVVVGSNDRITPPRLATDIVAHLPDADLIVVPGGGHMLPFEAPDRLAEIISGMALVTPTSLAAP